ncbi:hypothetical protein FOL47_003306 [Perkinsus chesapeaki]|uniref:SAM-dependent MTase RsmB/NOP-type domain-containing protein n=1 Tax=Perkinsus chesapeaki TaxID=330153 RepID=A0A7J6MZR4_PERCH|nr:hypothetical protein FOL47_003306 [Perkinsus chesapeaki]
MSSSDSPPSAGHYDRRIDSLKMELNLARLRLARVSARSFPAHPEAAYRFLCEGDSGRVSAAIDAHTDRTARPEPCPRPPLKTRHVPSRSRQRSERCAEAAYSQAYHEHMSATEKFGIVSHCEMPTEPEELYHMTKKTRKRADDVDEVWKVGCSIRSDRSPVPERSMASTSSPSSAYRFPADIVSFLNANGIPLELYGACLTVRQRFDKGSVEDELNKELERQNDSAEPSGTAERSSKGLVTPIQWLEPLTRSRFGPGSKFFSIPKDTQMSKLDLYKSGKLFGLDVSSASAVFALLGEDGPPPGSNVLDMCCAPGTKLLMLSELCPGSRVAGVDVSRDRLMVCRSLLTKYGSNDVELYHGDSRYICTAAVERLPIAKKKSRGRKRQRRASPEQQADKCLLGGEGNWDFVLCDAECTHDGSVKHMLKHLEGGSGDGVVGFWQQQSQGSHPMPWLDKLDELESLQRALITAAFDALKAGGVMVYSTCSMARRQDESIVEYLLDHKGAAAALSPLPFDLSIVPAKAATKNVGGDVCACRFDPADADMTRVDAGGLFIARIRKVL